MSRLPVDSHRPFARRAIARLLRSAAGQWGETILGMLYESWGERARRFDRAHRYVWNFDTGWERARYATALLMAEQHLPAAPWGNVLEVGCAKGVFTEMLAPRCQSLIAIDISGIACAAAAERCSRFSHVRVEQFDIVPRALPEQYDVVFALDLLEAIHGKRRLRSLIERLEGSLAPGGLLVVSSSRLPPAVRRSPMGEWLLEGADSHLAAFARRPGLRLVAWRQFPENPDDAPAGYPEHLIAVFKQDSNDGFRPPSSL